MVQMRYIPPRLRAGGNNEQNRIQDGRQKSPFVSFPNASVMFAKSNIDLARLGE